MLKILLILVIGIAIALLGFLFYAGSKSGSGEAPGLVDGRLAPCPGTPNCVSSEAPADSEEFIAPLAVADADIDTIAAAITQAGGNVVTQSESYLSAQFVSGLFKFVDDLEVRMSAPGEFQVRSASRVGKSDLGANRTRVEALRAALSG